MKSLPAKIGHFDVFRTGSEATLLLWSGKAINCAKEEINYNRHRTFSDLPERATTGAVTGGEAVTGGDDSTTGAVTGGEAVTGGDDSTTGAVTGEEEAMMAEAAVEEIVDIDDIKRFEIMIGLTDRCGFRKVRRIFR